MGGITNSMDMSLIKLQEMVKDMVAWHAAVRSPRECWVVSQDNYTVQDGGEEQLKCQLG